VLLPSRIIDPTWYCRIAVTVALATPELGQSTISSCPTRSASLIAAKVRWAGLVAPEFGDAELCVAVSLDDVTLGTLWPLGVGAGAGFVVGFGAGAALDVHADAAHALTHRAASSIRRIRPS
jgi:hypothetical protein